MKQVYIFLILILISCKKEDSTSAKSFNNNLLIGNIDDTTCYRLINKYTTGDKYVNSSQTSTSDTVTLDLNSNGITDFKFIFVKEGYYPRLVWIEPGDNVLLRTNTSGYIITNEKNDTVKFNYTFQNIFLYNRFCSLYSSNDGIINNDFTKFILFRRVADETTIGWIKCDFKVQYHSVYSFGIESYKLIKK